MAKTKISEFSTTPGNNTDINGINIAEGCAPSGINNAIRELMSDLKEWQSGAMDVYVIPQGTAAAPGIQLYGDLDTGLYGYAANQLGVAVGGASAGYFSSAGWVGNVNGTITGDINATTIDTTNIEVTNIKAKDGTAAITIADSTGVVSVSTQLAVDNLNLSGNTLSSSDTNGNIILAPNGTGDVYLDADTIRVGDSNTNVTITSNGTADLILNTNSGTNSGSITIQDGVNGNILIATNGTGQIQLTGDLDVANIETGAIKARDGTASATIANSTGVMTIASSVLTTTDINGGTIDNTVIGGATTAAGSFTTVTATQLDVDNLRFDANTISSTNTNGNIQIAPAGTGDVYLDADTVRIGDLNSDATLTTNGTADLILNTNSGSLSGSITIQDGVNGNILISPNGTGQVQLSGALDVTNIEVTNIKAKDGTAALSIADSTGVVSVSANPVLSGGTANGVLYLNGSKSATSGTALTFDGTNLGIGATPSSKLDLGGTVSSTEQIRFSMGGNVAWIGSVGSGTANGLGNLTFWTRDGSSAVVRYQIDGSGQSIWSVAGSEQMRLTSTGLGIGTTSPAVKLDVNGSFRVGTATSAGVTAQFGNTGNVVTFIDSGATTGNIGVVGANPMAFYTNGSERARITSGGQFAMTNDGTNAAPAISFTNDLDTGIFRPTTNTLGFATAGVQAMTLDASGNLGLGTTTLTNSIGFSTFSLSGSTGGQLAFQTSGIAKQYIYSNSTDLNFYNEVAGNLIFYTNNTERARITSDGLVQVSSGGSVQIGGTAARATTAGTNRLDIFNGTAPVGTLSNGISIYSSSGEAYVMDAAGNATLFSPHDAETNEWIFKSKHTPTGKTLKIDVEKLLRFINDHFGLDAVHEFIEE